MLGRLFINFASSVQPQSQPVNIQSSNISVVKIDEKLTQSSLNLPTLRVAQTNHDPSNTHYKLHYFMVAGKASKARPVEPFYIITYQMTCELLAPSPAAAWGNLCNQNGYSCNISLITSSCLLTIVLLSQFCNTAGGRDRSMINLDIFTLLFLQS